MRVRFVKATRLKMPGKPDKLFPAHWEGEVTPEVADALAELDALAEPDDAAAPPA